MFESTKRVFNKPDSEKNSFIFNFFCGSVAGSVSISVINCSAFYYKQIKI